MYLFPCTKLQHLREALAKPIRKRTGLENSGLLATPFRQALRALAVTCNHFGQDLTVWPPNPTPRKSSDVHSLFLQRISQ